MCTNCGSDEVELCSCQDGKHSWGLTSASTLVTSSSFVLTMSTVGQYGAGWAAVNEHVFIQGFGYYKVVSSTSSTISLTEPAFPFVGGAAFAANTVDFQSQAVSGNYTITSGTKVTPAGLKGTTGTTGNASSLLDIANTSAETSSGNAVTSSLGFVTLSSKVVTGLFATDKDAIRIRAKYFLKASVVGTYSYPKIIMTDNTGNTLALTQLPVSMGAGDTYLTGPAINKGVNACEIDIVITRASSTTADFQLDFDWKVLEDYTAESTDYAIRPLNFMLEQTGASFIWGDTPLTISFQGKVSDIADELKLGFYMIESLQKS